MSRKRFTQFIVIGVLLLFVGMAHADFASEVIELVNIEREARNLHPLSYNEELTLAARLHSQDMGDQNYFDHTSLDGREFYERIADAGYDYQISGENIAAGYPTPEAVVNGWMNSDGHRANILDPDYCDIGVGYAAVNGSDFYHYWTQDFGRRAGVTECPEPVAPPSATDIPAIRGYEWYRQWRRWRWVFHRYRSIRVPYVKQKSATVILIAVSMVALLALRQRLKIRSNLNRCT